MRNGQILKPIFTASQLIYQSRNECLNLGLRGIYLFYRDGLYLIILCYLSSKQKIFYKTGQNNVLLGLDAFSGSSRNMLTFNLLNIRFRHDIPATIST